jgi:hypothetical protein
VILGYVGHTGSIRPMTTFFFPIACQTIPVCMASGTPSIGMRFQQDKDFDGFCGDKLT